VKVLGNSSRRHPDWARVKRCRVDAEERKKLTVEIVLLIGQAIPLVATGRRMRQPDARATLESRCLASAKSILDNYESRNGVSLAAYVCGWVQGELRNVRRTQEAERLGSAFIDPSKARRQQDRQERFDADRRERLALFRKYEKHLLQVRSLRRREVFTLYYGEGFTYECILRWFANSAKPLTYADARQLRRRAKVQLDRLVELGDTDRGQNA